MPNTITLAQLVRHGACVQQRREFLDHFGNYVVVTEELAAEVATEFNWNWAAAELLSEPARAEYDRARAAAWAEYDRATAPARAEYDRVKVPAWTGYDRATALAWVEYGRVTAPAWAEYGRAKAEYDRAKAVAFARAYLNQ